MQYIKEIVFGRRAKGEILPKPKLPPERPYNAEECDKWSKEFKFGNRYGHRGSFYQKH